MSIACPKCGADTGTLETRPGGERERSFTRRRRICRGCSLRFTTAEVTVAEDMPLADVVVVGRAQMDEVLGAIVSMLADRIGDARTLKLVETQLMKERKDHEE